MLDALAYLPVNEIESGMRYLIRKIPQDDGLEALELLVNYFDATYVSGTIRRVKRPGTGDGIPKLNLRRKPPLFPPPLWNVHEATLTGGMVIEPTIAKLEKSWNYKEPVY